MKKLLALLSVIFLVILVGCQENQITEPVESLDKNIITAGEQMKLCCPLADPLCGRSLLNGLVNVYKKPGGLDAYANITYSFTINLAAELVDISQNTIHSRWLVKGTSDHDVKFLNNSDGLVIIHKGYPVTNREDVMLVVKYQVDRNGNICIRNMYLKEL